MKQLKIALPLLATSLFLGACSNKTVYQTTEYDLSKQSGLAIISQESQKAMHAQQMLVKYRQKENAVLQIQQADFENDKIMIDYIGKPQSILNSIAIKYGYRFLEVGHARSLPTINFNKYYTTPKDALALIDSQLGDTAKVYLDQNQKLITLTYQ